MSQDYLEIARQGKNGLWRYLLGISMTLFGWLIVGGVVTGIGLSILILIPLLTQNPEPMAVQRQLQQQLTQFVDTPSLGAYIVTNIPFIFFALSLFWVIKTIHQRPFLTLVSGDRTLRLKRLLVGFGVWLLLLLISSGLSYLMQPQTYSFRFDPGQWFLLLGCALILTPIQTSAEELFFRGYLLQGLGLLIKPRLILILVASLLFMLPHLGNPEMQRDAVWLALTYFAFGAFLTLITLKDDRLELALGVHAANNLSFVFFSTEDSALRMPALWMQKQSGDPRLELVGLLVMMAIAYVLFFGRRLFGRQQTAITDLPAAENIPE